MKFSDDGLVRALGSCALFEGLDDGELGSVFDQYRGKISSYDEGALLHLRGEPYKELYIILTGALRAEIQDAEGHSMTVETLPAPEAVATAILFSAPQLLPVSLFAAMPSVVLKLPRRALLALCRSHESVLLALLRDMGNRAQFLAEKLRFAVFMTIRQKIAAYLVEQHRYQGRKRVELTMSKQALAEVFGVTRPSLSRAFAELGDEGMITLDGRFVEIRDSNGLEAILAGCE